MSDGGRRPRVLLAGNPNAGKTTLFNLVTGARARVGNYPGVTVERRAGTWRLAGAGGREVEVVDLPGCYSLSATSPEEEVAFNAIAGVAEGEADAVVVVTDAGALARSLYLVLQIAETGLPVVVALNMMDEARDAGLAVDVARLSERLGVVVVPMTAARGEGRAELERAVDAAIARGAVAGEPPEPAVAADAIRAVEAAVAAAWPSLRPAARRARACWALLSLGDDEIVDVPAPVRQAVQAARAEAVAGGRDLDLEIVAERYRRIDELCAACVRQERPRARSRTERIDAVVTHRLWGTLLFVAVMALVFQALFAWSEPAIAVIEDLVGGLQGAVAGAMAPGPLRDLLVEGIVGGVGNVVVFVPQIALLFVFIGLLEDSGYLARVAFVIDRVMGRVGLHGKAFVPMLSGYACAVPAVMATRTIESRRDRLLTMLVVPLSSCSARLPVYVLVIAAVFPSGGGWVLLGMYLLSAGASLGAAAVLRRTVLRGPRPTMVLELPPYRWPLARNLAAGTWRNVRAFLTEAGSVILALTIVMWALLNFPKDDAVLERFDARRAEIEQSLPAGEAREAALAEVDALEAGEIQRHSLGGRLGHAIEPAIEPLGMDWRLGIGILGAFAAREVFVSTMGVVFDVGEEADEESEPLREALREARRDDGSLLVTRRSGLALMVFFVFACQCMSTIAVVRRESGGWKWPLFMFTYMTVLAYLAALGTYQIGGLL